MTKRSNRSNKEAQRIRDEMRAKRVKRDSKSAGGNAPKRRSRRNRIREVSIDELKDEYSYVLKDLRRILLLALAMFVLLIAANIFLPLITG
ncbi:MAG: hypothetical protein AAF902_05850 [Chloroflexota bacterium]